MPMRAYVVRAAAVLAAAFAAGCGEVPAGDAARLKLVRAKYSARYEFSIYDELYLHARARPGVRVESAEAERIYGDFFFPSLPTSESHAVYLNLYDDRGEFLYQLAWDQASHRFVRSQADAY